MSVLLLIAAGLFIRSFRHAQSIDTGFDAGHILTASIDLETRGYSAARGRELIRSLADRLEAAPGVVSVNLVDIVPVTLSNTTTYLLRDGDVEPAHGQSPPMPQIYANAVGPGHFRTLRIGMIAGRDFTDLDGAMPRHASRSSTKRSRGVSGLKKAPWASACGRSAPAGTPVTSWRSSALFATANT